MARFFIECRSRFFVISHYSIKSVPDTNPDGNTALHWAAHQQVVDLKKFENLWKLEWNCEWNIILPRTTLFSIGMYHFSGLFNRLVDHGFWKLGKVWLLYSVNPGLKNETLCIISGIFSLISGISFHLFRVFLRSRKPILSQLSDNFLRKLISFYARHPDHTGAEIRLVEEELVFESRMLWGYLFGFVRCGAAKRNFEHGYILSEF